MSWDRDRLASAGYGEGDRFVLTTVNVAQNGSSTTTSSTFDTLPPATLQGIVNLDSVPDDATLELRHIGQTGSTMDVEGDYRIRINPNEGGTTLHTTASSVTGTFTYFENPTETVDLREQVTVRIQARSDGTNTVSYFKGVAQFEVVL